MGNRINRTVPDLLTRRVFPQKIVPVPILRRSDWSRNKSAATVWADIVQNAFDASRAKRAFVGADPSFQ